MNRNRCLHGRSQRWVMAIGLVVVAMAIVLQACAVVAGAAAGAGTGYIAGTAAAEHEEDRRDAQRK